jgi:GT2 family glycosyltransferase
MVSVLITTHNSAAVIAECLNALAQQDCRPVEVIIIDNASTDGTRALLRPLEGTYRIIYNETNIGFAAGQNLGIRDSRGEWILSLNPDVMLSPSFLSGLIAAAEKLPRVGMVCGKLLRWDLKGTPARTNVVDSAGMYFMRNLRHLDRGSEEVDHGQFDEPGYVFGATGAAALYRREMIEDISVAREFFDEDFFVYREDADVAWRAQLMGWQCLYTPRSVGWHVRSVTPSRFKGLSTDIRRHCVKNRFLMRSKNISLYLYIRLLLPVTWRDFMIFGYSIIFDRELLWAFSYLLRRNRVIRRKRGFIQSHRRILDADLIKWFSDRPAAFELNGRSGQ